MGKTKNFLIYLIAVIIASSCACSFFIEKSYKVYAYSEDTYELAGYNYLIAQYEAMDINYVSLSKFDAINLYDDSDNVTAKMMIINRDGSLDYVILDFIVDKVNEFGFDQAEFISRFYGKGKIFYAGTLNYAYYDNNKLVNIYGEELDAEMYFSGLHQLEGELCGNYDVFSDGMYDYDDIETNLDGLTNGLASIRQTAAYCITGININDEIVDEKYYNGFKTQSLYLTWYNSQYGTNLDGACVPTALSNMLVYYSNSGFDLLDSNILNYKNSFDTFASVIEYTGFIKYGGDLTRAMQGLENYIYDKGYTSSTGYCVNVSYSQLVTLFKQNYPVVLGLFISTENVGHAVLGMGYLRYSLTYNNKTTLYSFIRVADGVESASKPRYIDMNGYFSRISAGYFMIAEK